ncbi:hypothetical protein F4779DRAFT_589272 [Xylariaceae sp. FL0662B]|nr:hypothetical protein F4779DRAFT_589272 [Xylariaceae sp. FL0662B]
MTSKEHAANPPTQPPHADTNAEAEGSSSAQTAKFKCRVCHEPFSRTWLLSGHAFRDNHATYVCNLGSCKESLISPTLLKAHKFDPHDVEHYRVGDRASFVCVECNTTFPNEGQLRAHADIQKHSPFECACGAKFSRAGAFYRHFNSFNKSIYNAKYPCSFCKRHRGKHGFRRRDHLVQHLRGYHKFDAEEIDKACPKERKVQPRDVLVCPHPGCEFHRGEEFRLLNRFEQSAQRPFTKQSDYSKHMKDVHKETPFPCHVAECDRVGSKGFMREKDLMKHLAAKHPEAPPYLPKPRQTSKRYGCYRCGKVYETSPAHDLHIYWAH